MDKKIAKYGLQDFRTLSQKHLEILKNSGITTIASLADITPIELKVLLDTTLNKATTILKEARDNLPPFHILDAKTILENNKKRKYLSTNCKALDDLLGGKGLESSSITEIFAQYGTGKSQFAFSCISSALQKTEDYPEGGSVIVVDTEGTCSPERISEILEYYKDKLEESIEDSLKHIKIVRPESAIEQKTIIKLFLEEDGMGYLKYLDLKKPLRLLVVDSVSGLFRAEYIGRGTLAERQQKLNEYLRDLYMFGLKTSIPVLITNQVMNSPDPFHPGEVPVGGHVVGHSSTYRIYLSKRKNYRVAKMVDSSRIPVKEVPFKLGRKGLIDVDEEDVEPIL